MTKTIQFIPVEDDESAALVNPKALTEKNDAVTAHIAPGDSKVAISASAQVLSGPGILYGFLIISFTTGATVRFSDAPAGTTPYVASAMTLTLDPTTKTGRQVGDLVMFGPNGIRMATACFCTITGTCEILPIAKQD